MIGTSQGETAIPLDPAEWVPRASGGDKGSFRTWSFNHTAYQDGLEKTLTRKPGSKKSISHFRFLQDTYSSEVQHSGMSRYAKECRSTVTLDSIRLQLCEKPVIRPLAERSIRKVNEC